MRFTVRTDKRSSWIVEAKSKEEAARLAALEIDDELVFGLETARGKGYFFKIRGRVPYPIGVNAAAVEVAMGQGA